MPKDFPNTFDHLLSFSSFANKNDFDVLSIEEDGKEIIPEQLVFFQAKPLPAASIVVRTVCP